MFTFTMAHNERKDTNLDLVHDFSELGVLFSPKSTAKGLGSRSKSRRFCPKLKIYREFALATLSAAVQKKKQKASGDGLIQLHALDGFSSAGPAAIQWKKHLPENVHVTAAEQDDLSLLEQNVEKNCLKCLPLKLDSSRIPGDPKQPQTSNEIFLCQADARAVMTMESFNFIYLSPHKSNGVCLDPAFQSLTSDGVLCLVVPDVCVFARSPHVVRHTFTAQVIRTEYLKEMAARIVLAEAARSAAKHSKGIIVLYVVSHEDFLLIAVQALRGQKAPDSSLDCVSQLLHCRFCEERVFLPNQLAPHENPYGYLTCSCKSANVGKTAVLLGPMWKGSIFETDFLQYVKEEGKKLQLSTKFFETVDLLLTESQCSSSVVITTEPTSKAKDPFLSKSGNFEIDEKNSQCSVLKDEQAFHSASAINEKSCPAVEQKDPIFVSGGKRNLDSTQIISSAKRQKGDCMESIQPVNIPFYYNVKKFKKTVAFKLNKLVTILRSNSHHASRTHFDSCAIRTSATVPQFLKILD